MINKKRILYCVLNWGLGHATRSVAVINELNKNNNVIIASDGKSFKYLQNYFPDNHFIQMPQLNITYSRFGFVGNLFRLSFLLINNYFKDRIFIKNLLLHEKYDLIISDNRFGCFHKSTESIYITHQLLIPLPPQLKAFERFSFFIHSRIINKYNKCWIPDRKETPNLSGKLSHTFFPKIPLEFIGILSRFSKENFTVSAKIDFCIILSGPEPFRNDLEQIVLKKFNNTKHSVVLIRGVFSDKLRQISSNIIIYNHLNDEELQQEILQSNYVICRAGYSSMMDLLVLKKSALLIPTPGQSEQKYLAEYAQKQKLFAFLSQKDFNKTKIKDLPKLFNFPQNYTAFVGDNTNKDKYLKLIF